MLGKRMVVLGLASTLAWSWSVNAGIFDLGDLRGETSGSTTTGPDDPDKVKKRTNYGPRMYGELAIGRSDSTASVDLQSSNLQFTYENFDKPLNYQLLAGYRFYHVDDLAVSLESFYSDLGQSEGSTNEVTNTVIISGVTIDESQTINSTTDVQNFGIGLNISVNLFPRLTAYAKFGIQRWQADYEYEVVDTRLGFINGVNVPQDSVQKISNDDESTDMYQGIGFSFRLSKALYLSLDYAMYNFDYLNDLGERNAEYLESISGRVGFRF